MSPTAGHWLQRAWTSRTYSGDATEGRHSGLRCHVANFRPLVHPLLSSRFNSHATATSALTPRRSMLLSSAPQCASASQLLLLLPLLLATLVAEVALHPANATSNWESRLPPASRSSYASLGEIKPWSGSIDSYKGLTTLLESCSFRKEIIIISTTDVFVDAAAQTVWMLRRFSIDHIIVMAPSEEACAATRERIPGICCAWNDIWFGLPPLKNKLSEHGFSGHRRLMQMRCGISTPVTCS